MTKKKTKKKINYPSTRKSASDSLTSAQEVVAAATEVIKVPKHIKLNETAEIYFKDIINERANADWSNHEVAVAAKLARMLASEDILTEALEEEGPVVESPKGGFTKNPTATVLTSVRGSIAAFRRQLCLHAQADNASSKDVAKRRRGRRAIEAAATEDTTPLLA